MEKSTSPWSPSPARIPRMAVNHYSRPGKAPTPWSSTGPDMCSLEMCSVIKNGTQGHLDPYQSRSRTHTLASGGLYWKAGGLSWETCWKGSDRIPRQPAAGSCSYSRIGHCPPKGQGSNRIKLFENPACSRNRGNPEFCVPSMTEAIAGNVPIRPFELVEEKPEAPPGYASLEE